MSQLTIDQALRVALEHQRAGRAVEADAIYGQILAREPEHAEALNLRASLLAQGGRAEEAIGLLRRAVAAQPGMASGYFNLGGLLRGMGDRDGAIGCYRKLLELMPGDVEGRLALGEVLIEVGRVEEAIACFREVVRLRPEFAAGHYDLGNAYARAGADGGRMEEAIASFGVAAKLAPERWEIHNNLGGALLQMGRCAEAAEAFERVLRLRPGFAEGLCNLGAARAGCKRLDEAAASWREAIVLRPELAVAHHGLAGVLKDEGLLEEANACYRRAMALEPGNAGYHSSLLFALNYHPASTRASLLEEAAAWARRHADRLAGEIRPPRNHRDGERRLRIGYMSADLYWHASALFLWPLFTHHDGEQVEVYAYAEVPRPDEMTRRFKGVVKGWRDIAGVPDERVAEWIREDGIDILVDLKLHTPGNRLLVLARKPAPVQVTWLGYPGTTGLDAIDYRLTDGHLDPEENGDAWSAEKLVRLPETFWCYGPLEEEMAVDAPPMETAGGITFGCLNNFCKVNEGMLELWARILGRVKGSRLLLLAEEGSHRERAAAVLERAGVTAGRLEFAAYRARRDYLRLYHQIDMVLDTSPYNGHTTSLDSFWMGVPVVTLVGPTAMGRAGLSQLANLGLNELVAETPEEYVDMAVELAGDVPRMRGLQATLRERMRGSALMDARRFAGRMEGAYREMWKQWCQRG